MKDIIRKSKPKSKYLPSNLKLRKWMLTINPK